MSRKKNKAQAGEELVPCCIIESQDFFVVGTGSSDDDLFRGDDEGTLCGSAAVEHLLDHGLEGLDDFALGDVLSRALDLVAFQTLGIVDGVPLCRRGGSNNEIFFKISENA